MAVLLLSLMLAAGVDRGPPVARHAAKHAAPVSAPASPGATPGAPAAPSDQVILPRAQVEQLQNQLQAAYAEVQRLRAIEASAKAATGAMEACTAKNVRLVRIGKDLLAAYDKRYHHLHRDPLQLGRTRFENEAQEYGDQIYDNRFDAVPRRQPGAQPAPTPAPADAAPAPTPPPADAAPAGDPSHTTETKSQ